MNTRSYLLNIFIYIFMGILAVLWSSSKAHACYDIIHNQNTVVIVKCASNTHQKIIRVGHHWYWHGNRYPTLDLAARASCGC